MQTAIYIRTSTEEQNPELQLKECESINQYGKYKLYKDQQSAFKDNIERIEFNKIRKEIKSRRLKHLIVWDLDRLYRNRKKLIAFFKFCKIYNCKIHSYNQAWLEELNGIPEPFDEVVHDMMLQVMGWISEEESKKKSARVKMAVRKKGNQPAKSYKGNKWGRKSLSTFKKNQIEKYILENPNSTMRSISKALNISLGVVHKYYPKNTFEKKEI